MLYEVTGKVIAVLPMVTGSSAKGEWKKATVVIEYPDGQYVNKLSLENMKNADKFASIPLMSEVTVKFSVQSRESNGRWFTSANAVSWDIKSETAPAAPANGSDPF